MPPEPLPWDRKERKHERSVSDSLGLSSSSARWRDHNHAYSHGSSRWGSDDSRRPHGYGKHGNWHLYSEDSVHGFVLSRHNGKILNEENIRPAMSSGDGKYGRNSRENKFSVGQDWRSNSWETGPSGTGQPYNSNHDRSFDNILLHNSRPHFDSVRSWDQPLIKDHHDRNDTATGLGIGQRIDRENSLGSHDWKTFKWPRSGSLSSRGSGLTHSSSSRSIGVESDEIKTDLLPQSMPPILSPSGDTATCLSPAAPFEDASSRKKPRLGWGEGLAKYEKKKVVVDDCTPKNGTLIFSSNAESEQSHAVVLASKSPRLVGFDCASPATPSSVGCSSSPGLEEKHLPKLSNVENDTNNVGGSPGLVSNNHSVGLMFDLHDLDLSSIASLSSSIIELLESDDPSSVDSAFGRSSAMSKLMSWKGDISKTLEMTESEIDFLENELKSLVCEPRNHVFPVASSILRSHIGPCEKPGSSNLILKPALPVLVSSVEGTVGRPVDALVEERHETNDQDFDSPGSATSKIIEPVEKTTSPADTVIHEESSDILALVSHNVEVACPVSGLNNGRINDTSSCGDDPQTEAQNGCSTISVNGDFSSERGDDIYDLILKSNKEVAHRASEVFVKLLPSNQCHVDNSKVLFSFGGKNDPLIEKKFAMRKRFLKFKERVLTLKYRAFHHLWKEDLRLLYVRKNRAKSHKKFDLSLLTMHSGHQKNRSSIRSRFSSPAGNLSLVPTSEVVNFTSKLLSDFQVKVFRNILKMPALILDRQVAISRFISCNGLVGDPCAVEKERSMINPWTSEEKEIFIEKLSSFGKDFRKIASFIDHKTTADCIEFYYKNQKSDCFKKTKKPDFEKLGKSNSNNTYLITSGKRWNREVNAMCFDMLGPPANETDMKIHKYSSKHSVGLSNYHKVTRSNDYIKRSNSFDFVSNERETVAADVLAGICGSLSSEAMSSCITTSVDPGEAYQEWKCQRISYSMRHPLTPEVNQSVDDETCSNESFGEMDSTDWTDEEKSVFIHALSSSGKDFDVISRHVGTKSRDQCKVFFSKARRVLGLDMINPVSGNESTPVSYDGNEGGSDETGSVVCGEKLHSKMSNGLPVSSVKVSPDLQDPRETVELQHVIFENDEKRELSSKDLEFGPESMGTENCDAKDEEELGFDIERSVDVTSNYVVLQGEENGLMPSVAKAMKNEYVEVEGVISETSRSGHANVKESDTSVSFNCDINCSKQDPKSSLPHCAQLSPVTEEVKTGDVCVGGPDHCVHDLDSGLLRAASLGRNLNNDKAQYGETSTCGLNYSMQAPNSILQPASETNRSIVCEQHDTEVDLCSIQKASVSLQEESCFIMTNSATQESATCNNAFTDCENASVATKINDQQCQESANTENHHQHLTGRSLLGNVESPRILKGYPLLTSAKEIGDANCNSPVSFQSTPKSTKNGLSDCHAERDCILQRCSGLRQDGKPVEELLPSLERNRDNLSVLSESLAEVNKPCRNGDFKLFGQILTHPSNQEKPNSVPGNEEKCTGHSKINGKPFDLKFSCNQGVEGNAASAKIDCNNYLSLENIPIRSYHFWDENAMQSSGHSLPDSTVLLAKYPAAFSNFTSSAKMEKQSLHAFVNSKERSMNGVSVFSSREISVSNGLAEYQGYKGRAGPSLQSFAVDMQQPQNIMFSEMQRPNGFTSSRVQQQTKGMVGTNVDRGVIVGGPCAGVTDPVTAIKMHYANAETTYGGLTGAIVREEDPRRGKGDLGR